MKRTTHGIQSLLAILTLASAGCGSSTTSGYSYYDPYYYYSYYPADAYYSSYYWTDPYSAYYFPAISPAGAVLGGDGGIASDAGISSDAGVSDAGTPGSISGFLTVGDVVRALALGQSVCANHVTITPKTGTAVCPSGGASTVNNGVTLVFNACTLSDGGKLDGTFDVAATRTASDTACNASTTVTVAISTTITNLTYVGPGGRKLAIPTLTGTSSFTYKIGQAPTSTALNLSGHLQVFGSNGSALLDNTFTGTATVSPQDKTGFALDGMLNLQDQLVNGATTTITSTGLTRETNCCRPTAGSITVVRAGASNAGTHTWTFGPTCGAATFDNSKVTLPASCL
jgi:hypothetical protein